jgi:hypothetical protein
MRNKKLKAHESAENVMEGSSQPVSTEWHRLQTDEGNPEENGIEHTMEEYYGKTDVEHQGGAPTSPPDSDPMPHQDLHKPKGPPKHNF